MPELAEVILEKLRKQPPMLTQGNFGTTYPWYNLSFSFYDFFNVPLGLVEGSMGAI